MFNSTLSWKEHVTNISNRIFEHLSQLRRNAGIFPISTRIHLIKTLIFPIFDYCCLVYNNLSQELSIRLDKVLNSCVRFIYDIPIYEHISPFYHKLKWLRLSNRREYFLGTFLYKLFTIKEPDNLYRLFEFKTTIHSSDLRNRLELHMPIHRTTMYSGSCTVHSVRFWNKIPINVRMSRNIDIFKRELSADLLRKM